MNTYTNSTHPKKKVYRIDRNKLFHNSALYALVLALVIVVSLSIYIANRPTVVAQNDPVLPYSNALELQYAQPWLDKQSTPIVAYTNALELQYAQPWLDKQGKPVVAYTNALELQYAQPWLDKQSKPLVATLNAQIVPICQSSIEMLYACKYGNVGP